MRRLFLTLDDHSRLAPPPSFDDRIVIGLRFLLRGGQQVSPLLLLLIFPSIGVILIFQLFFRKRRRFKESPSTFSSVFIQSKGRGGRSFGGAILVHHHHLVVAALAALVRV